VEHRTRHCLQSRGHSEIKKAVGILAVLILSTILQFSLTEPTPLVKADTGSEFARITPSGVSEPPGWGIFANNENNKGFPCYTTGVSCGDIQIDVNRTGIAVRIEIPREFFETVEVEVEGTISENRVNENDTYFVESNIRSDRYYYSLIDESKHWTYGWRGNESEGPCYKPNFPIFDPNAPWCLEIWNYLNGTFYSFTPPKFVRFHKLHAPTIAGRYNFTLFVADHTNSIGYPDFVHAWNTTLFVPVTLAPNPASIRGGICYDPRNTTGCDGLPITGAKGIAYAINSSTGRKVARAYVNQTDGNFTLTGLAPTPTNQAWGYYVTASAGVFRSGSQNISFSESDPLYPYDPYSKSSPVNPTYLAPNQIDLSIGLIHLRPSPTVTGTIRYVDAMRGIYSCSISGDQFLEHAVSEHPWFSSVGVSLLNITVEAYDDLQPSHIYRYQGVSNDANCGDIFTIITAAGESYVGLDPYGTEFVGLPPPDLGYHLTVRVWITGYVQSTFLSFSSQNVVNVGEIVMKSGALITGLIEFSDSTNAAKPHFQSPHYAELNTTGLSTDTLFGGNLIIEARYKDATGNFRLGGATVINGTGSDGKTTYALRENITFAIIGFSEFYNRTWASGRWLCSWSTFPGKTATGYCRDQGLGDPQMPAFDVATSVFVRGYDQLDTKTFTVNAGQIKEKNFLMVRGGVIEVQVFSYNNRPGTRAIQALRTWTFLNNTIAVRARVYVFTSHMGEVGYVECSITTGGPCSVTKVSFKVNFAGRNPTLREIWFYGLSPTRLAGDTSGEPYYIVKAFTLGYVQANEFTISVNRLDVRPALVILLKGNGVDVTAPILRDANPDPIFGKIPENDFVAGEVYGGEGLAGAVTENVTAGRPSLTLTVFGFGGMVEDGELVGQGHFFYVSSHIISDSSLCQNNRCFDYGIDVGLYSPQIPEFGFNTHLMQFFTSPDLNFTDLSLQQGVVFSLIIMAEIISGYGPHDMVYGQVPNSVPNSPNDTIPLSWVRVEAINDAEGIDLFTSTLDGRYVGAGALFLPAGNYTMTFSSPFYQSWIYQGIYEVRWSDVLSLLPLPGLCPENASCPNFSPPLSASTGQLDVGLVSTLSLKTEPRNTIHKHGLACVLSTWQEVAILPCASTFAFTAK